MFNRFLIFLITWCISVPIFASVQMKVDRDSLTRNDVLTLVIYSKDHVRISPDLSPLKKDFSIVGTSQRSQFNIINGSMQMETQWQIALLPKHDGDILLPSLQVGQDTTPSKMIHVTPVVKNISTQNEPRNQNVFIEASIIPKETFIDEQFVYTVKLFFNKTIENPFLMAPELMDAKVTQNGQDIIYSTVKNGQYYRVLERSYLITPKNPGSFQIQPAVLKGYLEGSSQPSDLYGFSNRTMRPIKIVGPILDVKVKPKPATFTGQWLPAKKVTLSEYWDTNPPVFREGEPVTRIIQVTAEGATGDQIPNLTIASTPTLNSYPQLSKRETNANENIQMGKMSQKIVFIPTASGKVILPAIRVHWWNSTTQKEQVATLPQKTIQVLPALIQSSSIKPVKKVLSSTARVAPTQVKELVTPHTDLVTKSKNYFWQIIAIVFIVIWLATIWMWRRQIKSGAQKYYRNTLGIAEIQNRLRGACMANNPKQARGFFLEWAIAYWKNPELHSLSDVVHLLENEVSSALLNEIMQLEAIFYSKNKQTWDGKAFWDSLQLYLQSKEGAASPTNVDPLPPLYY